MLIYVDQYIFVQIGVQMTKVSLNITVDKEVLDSFKKICAKNDIKVSTKINTLMKEWIEKNRK